MTLPRPSPQTLRRFVIDRSGESPTTFAVGAGGLALLLAWTLQAFEPEIATAYDQVRLAFTDEAVAMEEPLHTGSLRPRDARRVSPRLYGGDKYLREYN